MARKLKFSPKQHPQPGLFDFSGNLFEDPEAAVRPGEVSLPDEPSPSAIGDFVVNVGSQPTPDSIRQMRREALEMDRSSIRGEASMMFMSFGSGSSGNCSYVGDGEEGFLIDAGVDYETVRAGLKENGLSFHKIKGICLTHDHSDHVRFVYTIVKKYPHIGIYCTPKTLSGLLRRHSISRRIKDYHRPIYKEFPFKLGGYEITAFDVSHDGTDNSGFFIERGDHTMAVATDLGCITPRVDHYMRMARYIVIEANYDAEMLRVGPYPMYLKARIMKPTGHLDNMETGRFLREIAGERLSHVFLCHLSKDNNTPEIALRTVGDALREIEGMTIGDGSGEIEMRSRRIQLVALPRYDASPLYNLRAPL